MTKANENRHPHPGTIKTAMGRIGYLDWGPPDAPVLLAVHGWLDNAASFARLAPLVADRRLVAIDLPGHGRSQHRPPGMHYHFVDFVGDVVAAADALALPQFDLIGHSLGGGIASFVAAVAPTRVRRLILIEGIGPHAHPPEDNPPALRQAINQMLAHHSRPTAYASRQEAVKARAAVADFGVELAALIAHRNLVKGREGWRWRFDYRLKFKSPLYLTEEQVAAHLKLIAAPTLLLLGERGHHAVERHAKRTGWVTDLRIEMVPGGHHPHLDNPRPVADHINSFLGP